MRNRNYVLVYTLAFASIHLIESGFASQFGRQELFFSMIFSPMSIAMLAISAFMLILMERDKLRVAQLLRSDWAALLGTPLVFLAMKLVTMLYSLMVFVMSAVHVYVPVVVQPELPDTIYVVLAFIALAGMLHLPILNVMKKAYPLD